MQSQVKLAYTACRPGPLRTVVAAVPTGHHDFAIADSRLGRSDGRERKSNNSMLRVILPDKIVDRCPEDRKYERHDRCHPVAGAVPTRYYTSLWSSSSASLTQRLDFGVRKHMPPLSRWAGTRKLRRSRTGPSDSRTDFTPLRNGTQSPEQRSSPSPTGSCCLLLATECKD